MDGFWKETKRTPTRLALLIMWTARDTQNRHGSYGDYTSKMEPSRIGFACKIDDRSNPIRSTPSTVPTA